jgi:hypothetical protein
VIFELAEDLLAFQEGLCSVELISWLGLHLCRRTGKSIVVCAFRDIRPGKGTSFCVLKVPTSRHYGVKYDQKY